MNVASESLQGQASFPALDRLSCEDNSILKVISLASNDQECSGVEEDKVKDGVTRRLELVVEQVVEDSSVLFGPASLDGCQWMGGKTKLGG